MRRFTRLFSTALTIAALAPFQARAQTATPTAIPQAPTAESRTVAPSPGAIRARSPLVLAPVTVVDPSGNFVQNLHQEQFHVWDEGVEQKITYFNAATEPVAAVVLVQNNLEVEPMLPEIQPLGSLISDLLLGNSGEAAIVTYSDQPKTIQDFTGNPETIAAIPRTIDASGKNSRLNDALMRSILLLSHQQPGKRRVVIVFSEGFDRGSVTTGADVVRAASTVNVTIYGIRFSPAGTEWKDEGKSALTEALGACPGGLGFKAHPCNFALNIAPLAILATKAGSREMRANLLGQYTEYTGGIIYTHWRDHAVQDQLQSIALAVNGQYNLAYVPTGAKNPGFHPLKITVSESGLRVRTRAGYFYVPPHD